MDIKVPQHTAPPARLARRRVRTSLRSPQLELGDMHMSGTAPRLLAPCPASAPPTRGPKSSQMHFYRAGCAVLALVILVNMCSRSHSDHERLEFARLLFELATGRVPRRRRRRLGWRLRASGRRPPSLDPVPRSPPPQSSRYSRSCMYSSCAARCFSRSTSSTLCKGRVRARRAPIVKIDSDRLDRLARCINR